MKTLLQKHAAYFPEIDSLYDYQVGVLEKLSAHENTLAIIPTGGGKSLLYQLISLELQGITLVISPLLALMKEQVDELNERGIKSLALNSSLSFLEQRSVLRDLKSYSYKIIYISPERLQNPFFRACLIASGIKIDMLVVDEAHCISQWGGGFRPDYGQIMDFHHFLTNNSQKPFLFCLTATLSSLAKDDIISEFKIKKENIIATEVLRENLKLHFIKVDNEKLKANALREFLLTFTPQKSIAYLYSKRECEKYSNTFSSEYLTAFYHAGMDAEDRNSSYQSFVKNQVQLLFATTAFGMGINIPNIESVIHLQIPNSIEEYYQHVGRGWRDKKQNKDCQCLALWSEVNFDRRGKEIAKEKWTKESLIGNFKSLTGSAKIKKIGQVVNKDKAALLGSDSNLQLLRYKLEKYNAIRTVGEINGTPLTIELKSSTPFWNSIANSAKSGMDSFGYVCSDLNIRIEKIIDHLYEQDLANNIKKLPAMKKDIYFEILLTELSDELCESVVDEMNKEIDLRLKQLGELKELFQSNDYSTFIRNVLNES